MKNSHAQARLDDRLRDLLDLGGIALVTDEAGAGKTVAARVFVRSLDSGRFVVVAPVPPLSSPHALLRSILSPLGETPERATPDALTNSAASSPGVASTPVRLSAALATGAGESAVE